MPWFFVACWERNVNDPWEAAGLVGSFYLCMAACLVYFEAGGYTETSRTKLDGFLTS